MEVATLVECQDIPARPAHKWEKDSKGHATHAELWDTHGTNAQNSRMEKERERKEE